MMRNGLNASQVDAVKGLLKRHHRIRTIVQLLDTNHNHIDTLTSFFMDGQVNVDTTAEISRSCDLTFLDPLKALHLDPNSPSPTGVYIAYMMKVIVQVIEPDNSKWYDIPVFTGPIDSIDRDGIFLDVKCLGKESLLLDPIWHAQTYKGKPIITDVMINILFGQSGEALKRIDIPSKNKRASKPVHLKRDTKPWLVLKKLANDVDMDLFYDGRGVCIARPRTNTIKWTFNEANIESRPKVGYDLANVTNAVLVIGGKAGKKDKTVPQEVAYPPATHPLNPWSSFMKRGGRPRYINPITVTESNLKTVKACRARAKAIIDNAMISATEVTFDAFPVYLLEPYDMAELDTVNVNHKFYMNKYVLPLTADGNMSVGYLKRADVKSRDKRKRKSKTKNKKRRNS